MSPSKTPRPSRITIACNSCRTRKQKCSGKRPVCTQCSQHNRRCDWPEQLKRGPAKGYIEVLEHRLHETENALLMVLSRISDEQFLSVSERDQSNYLPSPRQEKKGTEYWKEFPLDTADNIRRWQYDNHDNGPTESSNGEQNSRSRTADNRATVAPSDMSSPKTTSGLNIRRGIFIPESISNPRQRSFLTGTHNTPRPAWNMPPTLPTGQRGNGESSQPTTPVFQQNGSLLKTHEQFSASDTPREPSQWSEAPSFKFQEQFLW
ncbi:hypothetical protein P170DRAFT_35635 [Aspergillus steynii IBT 23096]|uniref:Zn(2)-C6 fungal-type domain-containing protein n=1 Tax=Aspergillus steynii IBT 23096 TaxID=1392250 RepID=A0A2I2GQQ4_9EURO|nr:uncharacterized protein P170DRAFT_35635 [Aspergillus steynii IBT 23096]PLB55210.1 hypothetical protein P170DRAFT_35635 [Aspergillus steynii IBT 23096]